MLIDSHAHLDSYSEEDRGQVLDRAQAAGVKTILSIGIGEGPDFMHQALEIAKASTSPKVYASAGIHPEQAHNATPEALAKLAALAADPKCLAIGEIGLDYYHLENPAVEIQQAAFIAQMAIAAQARKPILIHLRTSELATAEAKAKYAGHDCTADFFCLIEQHWAPTGLPGVLHCFSGTPEDAARAIPLGFYLSFAGNLTYPRSIAIREAAAITPADRILVETDCPFLAPIPHRGQRNEPALMTHTAAALAELRGISPEELANITTANFHRLFPTTI
jgi:TatD DNase family protein